MPSTTEMPPRRRNFCRKTAPSPTHSTMTSLRADLPSDDTLRWKVGPSTQIRCASLTRLPSQQMGQPFARSGIPIEMGRQPKMRGGVRSTRWTWDRMKLRLYWTFRNPSPSPAMLDLHSWIRRARLLIEQEWDTPKRPPRPPPTPQHPLSATSRRGTNEI